MTVSIITPCYNAERFLAQTLQSARAQTVAPLEIIVIDDGSTDDSAAIAAAAGDPVRVLRQTNHGESVARNRGVAEARGTHLLFLDADDLLAPRAVETLLNAVSHRPDAVALMGHSWFSDDPAKPSRVHTPTQNAFFPGIIQSNFGPPHAWLSPADLVRRAGAFHEPLRWFEDWVSGGEWRS
ncbi:MAG: glycosyltransferase [Vicinamibacterales bacterium]